MPQEVTELAQDILEIIPPFMRLLAAELRQTGHSMTPGNFQLLFILQEGPANLSELAEYQNVSLPTMSRSVSRIEKIGWIERNKDPGDRRVTLIALTDDGRRQLEEMSALAQETLGKVLRSTSDADRAALSAGLEIMRRSFGLHDTEKK